MTQLEFRRGRARGQGVLGKQVGGYVTCDMHCFRVNNSSAIFFDGRFGSLHAHHLSLLERTVIEAKVYIYSGCLLIPSADDRARKVNNGLLIDDKLTFLPASWSIA